MIRFEVCRVSDKGEILSSLASYPESDKNLADALCKRLNSYKKAVYEVKSIQGL